MRKILDFTETAVLTVFCLALIGIMIFEQMVYSVIEIFENGRE